MSDMRAWVVTPWIGDGTPQSNPLRPLLTDLYPAVDAKDVTGQRVQMLRPDPNTLTLEIVCDAETLDQIEADARFAVLWSEAADASSA